MKKDAFAWFVLALGEVPVSAPTVAVRTPLPISSERRVFRLLKDAIDVDSASRTMREGSQSFGNS